MKEKELRLALVYFGGVSLAVYQHGVNVEILNLIRASKAYHRPRTMHGKQAENHLFAGNASQGEEYSTEPVYFELLKQIGRTLDLRVIADVISGSSAGGINGIVLARAIAHDLSLSPLTKMWFAKADLLELIASEARASKWSKWYFLPFMRPLITRLAREGVLPRRPDAEVRERLSTFLRSRWFKPPFDGRHFSNLLLDGLAAMEGSRPSASTLLPPDMWLDLLITVTDYHGLNQPIYIHDPPVIHEPEHRQILRFQAERSSRCLERSDFDYGNIPALAFAGRASASYPGAFPPAQLREIDEIVEERALSWSGRAHFLQTNFARYDDDHRNPEEAVLLDGSILNNKPILAAIEAIRAHGAYREVDRRLVYIDPHAERPNAQSTANIPGFFATLRGALSDLPRNDPIYEELAETNWFNDQIDRLKAIIRISRPQVDALIEQATGGELAGDVTLEKIRHWRLTSANMLASTAIVYNAWMRSLILEGVDFIGGLVSSRCGYQEQSQPARWARKVIEAWCDLEGMFPENYVVPPDVAADNQLPAFARFIVDFGVRYKRRRIYYLLKDINRLYESINKRGFCATGPDQLDALKRSVNACLRSLAAYNSPDFLGDDVCAAIRRLFNHSPDEIPRPEAFAAQNREALAELFAEIGKESGLVGTNEELDALLASPLVSTMGEPCRRAVLTGYLGWPYWDVILLPAMNALGVDASACEEVLVDRISPSDARTVRISDNSAMLQGTTAIGFGGFLSRKARENDYLWGRVHGIDRLIDILASTFEPLAGQERPDFHRFKKSALQAMLGQEGLRLTHIPETVAAVKAAVAKL